MRRAPWLDIRDAIAAHLVAAAADPDTFGGTLAVSTGDRPLSLLPDGILRPLCHVFATRRRSDQTSRAGLDVTYETAVCLHDFLRGDTDAERKTNSETFQSIVDAVELQLINLPIPPYAWLELETPGADKFPFLESAWDEANQLVAVLTTTYILGA